MFCEVCASLLRHVLYESRVCTIFMCEFQIYLSIQHIPWYKFLDERLGIRMKDCSDDISMIGISFVSIPLINHMSYRKVNYLLLVICTNSKLVAGES